MAPEGNKSDLQTNSFSVIESSNTRLRNSAGYIPFFITKLPVKPTVDIFAFIFSTSIPGCNSCEIPLRRDSKLPHACNWGIMNTFSLMFCHDDALLSNAY